MGHHEDKGPASQPRGRLRVPVDYPVLIMGESGLVEGTVRNLTISGGEVESKVLLAIGERLRLHVQPPSARPPIVIAAGIVQWNEGNRFGIEFVSFEGQAKQQLEEMLNQYDGSSAG
jgi:PilZ domain